MGGPEEAPPPGETPETEPEAPAHEEPETPEPQEAA